MLKDEFSHDKFLQYLLYGLFAAYVIFQLWNYFSDGMIYDEMYLHGYVSQARIKFLHLNSPNYLYYGSLYWQIQALATAIGKNLNINTFYIMRFFTVPFAILPAWILVSKSYWPNVSILNRLIALVFFLSMPFAYFTGKITGPEVFSLALAMLSLALLANFKVNKAVFLMGIAFGIKATVLPILVYGFLIKYLFVTEPMKPIFSWRELLRQALYFALGFLVANPFLIFNYHLYQHVALIAQANSVILCSNSLMDFLHAIFFGELYPINDCPSGSVASSVYWGGDLAGGMVYWFGSAIVGICLFLLLAFRTPKSIGVSFAFSVLFSCLILIIHHDYLPWYSFPILALYPLALLYLKLDQRWVLLIIISLIGINFVCGFPLIRKSVHQKLHFANLYQQKNKLRDTVITCIGNQPVNTILDYSDVPGVLSHYIHSPYHSEIIPIFNSSAKQIDIRQPQPIIHAMLVGIESLHKSFQKDDLLLIVVGSDIARRLNINLAAMPFLKKPNNETELLKTCGIQINDNFVYLYLVKIK